MLNDAKCRVICDWTFGSRKGEYERAIAEYDQAIKHSPEFAEAFLARGIAYSQKGERDRSIADYTRAIQLDGKLSPGICSWAQRALVRIAGCP